MSEILETVARALYIHGTRADEDPYVVPWETLREKYKDTYRDSAKAALQAIRDLTEATEPNRPVGSRYEDIVRNRVVEACARVAENPGFVEARDSDWDLGFNYAKYLISKQIRLLAA